ncbi:MAG TPA: hypothetical protein VFZ75_05540 [Actinomycetota bacterium]|nr:hypothetical protein [Actinomycetota bacterium]
MKLARIVPVIVLSVSLSSVAPALADPPPTNNKNTSTFAFRCSRGAETMSFQAIAIAQSASISGHVVDGRGTVIFTHIEVNGQVIYDAPGQADRSELWTCTIDELAGVVVQVFLTPRG